MLPTAASYAVMSNRRPSTGSTFTWLWEATIPPVGIWLGWVLVITYICGCILQPVMFGLFFNSLLDYFGISTSYWTATVFGLVAIVVVGVMTKRDIRVSARVTAIFIGIEAGLRRAARDLHHHQAGDRREPVGAAAQPGRGHARVDGIPERAPVRRARDRRVRHRGADGRGDAHAALARPEGDDPVHDRSRPVLGRSRRSA